MDIEAVLDSSVVLAFVHGEPGGEESRMLFSRSIMCAINVSEVAGKLFEDGLTNDEVRTLIGDLGIFTADDDFELALVAGALRPATRHLGLSIGDRFCLALGQRTRLPVYTADRKWAALAGNMDIRLIR